MLMGKKKKRKKKKKKRRFRAFSVLGKCRCLLNSTLNRESVYLGGG